MKQSLYAAISRIESLARGSRLKRFLAHPLNYPLAMGSKAWHRLSSGRTIVAKARCAWGDVMQVNLPAGMDIFLTGGKSHDSEIRFSKFLLSCLKEGDCFFDIGSHLGFYSLLSRACVGSSGTVVSVEAAPSSFALLKKNTSAYTNILPFNRAAGKEEGFISFYEFPALYAEYNTSYPDQFELQPWFRKKGFNKISLELVTIDGIISQLGRTPKLIKIDTEGAEADVVLGAFRSLDRNSIPFLAMEFLPPHRQNANHKEAATLLRQHGYLAHTIDGNGKLFFCPDPAAYMEAEQKDSDMIVFTPGR